MYPRARLRPGRQWDPSTVRTGVGGRLPDVQLTGSARCRHSTPEPAYGDVGTVAHVHTGETEHREAADVRRRHVHSTDNEAG